MLPAMINVDSLSRQLPFADVETALSGDGIELLVSTKMRQSDGLL